MSSIIKLSIIIQFLFYTISNILVLWWNLPAFFTSFMCSSFFFVVLSFWSYFLRCLVILNWMLNLTNRNMYIIWIFFSDFFVMQREVSIIQLRNVCINLSYLKIWSIFHVSYVWWDVINILISKIVKTIKLCLIFFLHSIFSIIISPNVSSKYTTYNSANAQSRNCMKNCGLASVHFSISKSFAFHVLVNYDLDLSS